MNRPVNAGLIVLNGGELSPLLDARADLEKYAAGCRVLENFIPRRYGNIEKRPGTIFVAYARKFDTE